MLLSIDDKKALLQLARSSIECAVSQKPLPTVATLQQNLHKPCGAFVTVRVNGELRGCYGYVNAYYPLAQSVQEVAVRAALEDPRFEHVAAEELDALEIEVSVLAPPENVERIEEIEVGVHGLILETRLHRGLLLPSVPTEYGWDREQFLNHTALKAGLPPDAWKNKSVSILKFTAEKFSESDFVHPEPYDR
ncbi:MAG TPA: AmmeMemoRadiSam system protein A [Bacteroidota bacterium]